MKISNVKYVVRDWFKAGYRFGGVFSDYLTERLNMSPRSAKISGGIFDVAAGSGLVYMAATSAIGTIMNAVAAVAVITTAPLAAVATVALGVIWLTFSCMTAGIGLGLLGAARKKCGLPSLSSFIKNTKASVKNKVKNGAGFLKKPFKADAKISHKFKNAANGNQPSDQPVIKPAPAYKRKFTL